VRRLGCVIDPAALRIVENDLQESLPRPDLCVATKCHILINHHEPRSEKLAKAQILERRKDRRGVDLISEALAFGRLWRDGPGAVSNAVCYAEHCSRSHHVPVSI
jgi:hypothetical protein